MCVKRYRFVTFARQYARGVPTRIVIASPEGHAGKSIVALGLVEALSRRVERVGPVQQHGQGGGAPGEGRRHGGVAGRVELVGALLREGEVGGSLLGGVAVGRRDHHEVHGGAAREKPARVEVS